MKTGLYFSCLDLLGFFRFHNLKPHEIARGLKKSYEKVGKFQESILIFKTWLSYDGLAECVRLLRWWITNCLVLAHFLKEVQTFYTFLICFNSVCIFLYFLFLF